MHIQNPNCFSSQKRKPRRMGHGIFPYPAMMVPFVVRAILEEIFAVYPSLQTIYDPFAGSGTVLTEALNQRMDFVGADINPLAILLCKVKSGPFHIKRLQKVVEKFSNQNIFDSSNQVDVSFPNIEKWFSHSYQVQLSRIRRAILAENSLWVRRFLWIGLAETVKLVCNSRTSTAKLHIRTDIEINALNIDAFDLFLEKIHRNFLLLQEQSNLLHGMEMLNRGYYKGRVDIRLADSRTLTLRNQTDIIFTSPPYGDNTTTVPYGQFSYLPLQWIHLDDIDSKANKSFLLSTQEIDARSLGGSKRVNIDDEMDLIERSPSLALCLERLCDQPPDRTKRVLSFIKDLDLCLDPMLASLRTGGLLVWTVGNRSVGNQRIPLNSILTELLMRRGILLINKMSRRISSKRMAMRNNYALTMQKESILILRKE